MRTVRSRTNPKLALRLGLLLSALFLVAPLPAEAIEFCASEEIYTLPKEETRTGDIYAFSKKVDVQGYLEGDLIAFGETVDVFGTVTGDLIAGASIVTVGGQIGDSTRLAGSQVIITGTIEGDLLAAGSIVTLSPGSRVTGDVLVGGAQININGDVDGNVTASGGEVLVGGTVGGDLRGTAGQISLSGQVARDVKLKCDTLKVSSSARVEGTLSYTAREPVEDLEGMGVVAGEITYQKKEKKVEEKKGLSWSWVFTRVIFFVASLLVGFVLLRLFPRHAVAIQGAISRDGLPSFGVGFVIAIVLPVGAIIVSLFVVTIPLAVIIFMLYMIALYLAKLPVALWLGRSALRLIGMASPSPYLALAVGLVPVFVLFYLPFMLGWILWFLTIFLGLGAIFLGVQSAAQSRSAGAGGPTEPTSSPA